MQVSLLNLSVENYKSSSPSEMFTLESLNEEMPSGEKGGICHTRPSHGQRGHDHTRAQNCGVNSAIVLQTRGRRVSHSRTGVKQDVD